MNKKLLISLTCLSLGLFNLVSASEVEELDDLVFSGFGSVAVGEVNNNVGYAGYTDGDLNWKPETLLGLQADFRVNEKIKIVTQVVINGKYDFNPKLEMAYISYDLDLLTIRAGKLRLPLFFYSDYVDLGYAMPMIRPSQELYEKIIFENYKGIELLIPINFKNSNLLFQPLVGIGEIDEDDSSFGEINLEKLIGFSINWNIDDFVFRGSYFSAEAVPQCNDLSNGCQLSKMLDGEKGQFISIGTQYDSGNLLFNIEATDVSIDGSFSDYTSISALVGYNISDFTPYVSTAWSETTDDNERKGMPTQITSFMDLKTASYSVGARWDFIKNMAFKFDITYVDYLGTSGGFVTNIDPLTGTQMETSSILYSARLDFIF